MTNRLFRLAVVLVALVCLPAGADEHASGFPAVAGDYYVVERMLVKPGKEAWFETYWKETLLPVFEKIDGFEGGFMATVIPAGGLKPADYDFGPLLPLGPPDQAFLPHGGIQLNGVQTDVQINFDSVMRGTYNYKVIHFWRDAKSLQALVPQFANAWKEVHGDDDAWGILTRDYFSNLENHWDLVFRVIR
ncbi:MAG: hypothetical protein HKO62_12365 [Gammaproteobacteria bacterium]|nr:hypothetical protein [Gammaproteobacteria bacterium]